MLARREWTSPTKLDGLSDFDTIKVRVAYEFEGKRYDSPPCHQTAFHRSKPIYEESPGCKTDIAGCRTFASIASPRR